MQRPIECKYSIQPENHSRWSLAANILCFTMSMSGGLISKSHLFTHVLQFTLIIMQLFPTYLATYIRSTICTYVTNLLVRDGCIRIAIQLKWPQGKTVAGYVACIHIDLCKYKNRTVWNLIKLHNNKFPWLTVINVPSSRFQFLWIVCIYFVIELQHVPFKVDKSIWKISVLLRSCLYFMYFLDTSMLSMYYDCVTLKRWKVENFGTG